jgi:hypothetical protein
VALWVATLVYIEPYDGWGAWAAAPLLLPAIALSTGWAAAGVLTLVANGLRRCAFDVPVAAATAIGGFVIAYYVVWNLVR